MAFVTYEYHDALQRPEHGKKRFNEIKLRHICDKLKLEPETLTIDECILLGIQAGETRQDIGPFDPAYLHFVEQERAVLQLGEFLLVREEYIQLVKPETT